MKEYKCVRPLASHFTWHGREWTIKERTEDVAIFETIIFKSPRYLVVDIYEIPNPDEGAICNALETWLPVQQFVYYHDATRKVSALLDYAPMAYLKIIHP